MTFAPDALVVRLDMLLSDRSGRFQAELVGGHEGRSVSFLEPAGRRSGQSARSPAMKYATAAAP